MRYYAHMAEYQGGRRLPESRRMTFESCGKKSIEWDLYSKRASAIEASREFCGVGIFEVEGEGSGRVGLEQKPIDQIGRCFEDVVLAWFGGQGEIHYAVRTGQRRTEFEWGVNVDAG